MKEAYAVFEKGILKGKCTELSFAEGRQLFAVCYFLAGVRGMWCPNEKKPKYSAFHSTVTVSDWAFGFMLLGAHRPVWLLEMAGKKSKEAKRTRADQQKCMKEYHEWFARIDEAQNGKDGAKKTMYPSIDQWLMNSAKDFAKEKVSEMKKPATGGLSSVKREESYSLATFENMREANPFLLAVKFEEI